MPSFRRNATRVRGELCLFSATDLLNLAARRGLFPRGSDMSNQSLRKCYRCQEFLPQERFGVRRASKDGLNTYCKNCIHNKIKEGRVRDRERRANIKALLDSKPLTECVTPKQRAVGLIKEALRAAAGPLTQEQLRRGTHLGRETLCDALADLILWQREVRSMVVGDRRVYLLARTGAAIREVTAARAELAHEFERDAEENAAQAGLPRPVRAASAA
jgi:hypothetical protein